MVCNIGTLPANSTQSYLFEGRVRPEVPNDTVLGGVEYRVKQGDTLLTTARGNDLTISARPEYDFSMIGPSLQANQNTASVMQMRWNSNTQSNDRILYNYFSIGTKLKKGISPARSTFSVDIDLSPLSFIKNGDKSKAIIPNDCSIVNIRSASSNISTQISPKGDNIGASTDSGSIPTVEILDNCIARITFNGVNTTAWHYPTTFGDQRTPLPDPQTAWIASYYPYFVVKNETIRRVGIKDGESYSLLSRFEIQNVQMYDLYGNLIPENKANTESFNDYRQWDNTLTLGNSWRTYYLGYNMREGNTESRLFDPSMGSYHEGPLGSSFRQAHDGLTVPGNPEIPTFYISNSSSLPKYHVRSTCVMWDKNKQHLDFNDTPPARFIHDKYSDARTTKNTAVIPQFSAYTGTYRQFPEEWIIKVEYGKGEVGDDVPCSSATNTQWTDDPNDPIFNNDPSKVTEKVYTGIDKVRFTMAVPPASGGSNSTSRVSIKLRTNPDLPAGVELPYWATPEYSGYYDSMEEALNVDPKIYTDYNNNSTRTSNFKFYGDKSGVEGDMLTTTKAVTRTDIKTFDNNSGEHTDTTKSFTSGDKVVYSIKPVLSLPVTTDYESKIYSEVCIPRATMVTSTSIPAIASQFGSPSDAETQCGTEYLWMKFDHGTKRVNTQIAELLINTIVSQTANNGDHTAITSVYSPSDASVLANRTDNINIILQVPAGVKINKLTTTPVMDITLAGNTAPREQHWQVEFANTTDNPVTNIDIIDKLPKQGYNGTNYTGSFELSRVVAPTGSTVLYTKDPNVVSDPDAVSNKNGGSTVWCAGFTGGSCPSSIGESTGFRVLNDGPYGTGSDPFIIDIYSIAMGNVNNDKYMNEVSARVNELVNTVGPALAEIIVMGGSIGDTVWEDTNQNGIQDEGEKGIPNVIVRLTGNGITRTVTTDDNGNYRLDNLPAGDYTLTFTTPDNMVITTKSTGDDNTIDSDIDTTGKMIVSIASGENRTDVDAGYYIPFVDPIITKTWDDANGRFILTVRNDSDTNKTKATVFEDAMYAVFNATEGIMDKTVSTIIDPTRGTVSGNTWSVPELAPGESITAYVPFNKNTLYGGVRIENRFGITGSECVMGDRIDSELGNLCAEASVSGIETIPEAPEGSFVINAGV